MEYLPRKHRKGNFYLNGLTGTKPWIVVIKARARLNRRYYESSVVASNGRTNVSLQGARATLFNSQAQLECELRAARSAFDWLKHLAAHSKSKVILSHDACAILRGESACPPQLKAIRTQLLRQYFSLRNMVIEGGPLLPPAQAAQQRRTAT